MSGLTVTRKADREKMVATLIAELHELALVARNSDLEAMHRRAIFLDITTERGLSVTVDFDGDSPHPNKDTYVLSWHLPVQSKDRLSEAFCPGGVNTVHRHKATDVTYGFENLRWLLHRRIALARSGEAFE